MGRGGERNPFCTFIVHVFRKTLMQLCTNINTKRSNQKGQNPTFIFTTLFKTYY